MRRKNVTRAVAVLVWLLMYGLAWPATGQPQCNPDADANDRTLVTEGSMTISQHGDIQVINIGRLNIISRRDLSLYREMAKQGGTFQVWLSAARQDTKVTLSGILRSNGNGEGTLPFSYRISGVTLESSDPCTSEVLRSREDRQAGFLIKPRLLN